MVGALRTIRGTREAVADHQSVSPLGPCVTASRAEVDSGGEVASGPVSLLAAAWIPIFHTAAHLMLGLKSSAEARLEGVSCRALAMRMVVSWGP